MPRRHLAAQTSVIVQLCGGLALRCAYQSIVAGEPLLKNPPDGEGKSRTHCARCLSLTSSTRR